MPATLRRLLAEPAFHLRLVHTGVDGTRLDAPIAWAHSSDLADPTPWLEPGQLLLTDGMQLPVDGDGTAVADAYVARLAARDVRLLGFATEIIHGEVPAALTAACAAHDVTLVEIADRAPFMAIIRYVADEIARERRERLEWSLAAQRAVARAALRPDGLGAIVAELEHRLGCWVALFDATGAVVATGRSRPIPDDVAPRVGEAARRSLSRRAPGGARIDEPGLGATLLTLGRREQLRGVLAVGTSTPLDPAGNDLVASVIGLASIALEQSRALASARHGLRAGLLELMLAGTLDVAARTSQRLWGSLPTAPLRVALLAGDADQAAFEALELLAEQRNGRLFWAERDERVVVIARAADTVTVEALGAEYGLRVGVSAETTWDALDDALDEAERALARTGAERGAVRFDGIADEGLIGLLEASGGRDVARRMLEPLRTRHPDGETLVETLRVWLEQNCGWDAAARALGVHRHTLRNRITVVEQVLGVDLERFGTRAELWAALQFVDPAQR